MNTFQIIRNLNRRADKHNFILIALIKNKKDNQSCRILHVDKKIFGKQLIGKEIDVGNKFFKEFQQTSTVSQMDQINKNCENYIKCLEPSRVSLLLWKLLFY